MYRTLVIGYGNIDRADDGVAFHVVNSLRRQLEQPPLAEFQTGLETLGSEVDSVFLRQLLPELMETAGGYEQVVFVDAHVNDNPAKLVCAPVSPQFVPSAFTHHTTPATFLAMMREIYFRQPAAQMLSIRGYEFDFRRSLSQEAKNLVRPAVDLLLRLLS